MTFRETCAPYITPEGWLTSPPNDGPTNNRLLDISQYYCRLKSLRELTPEDGEQFSRLIQRVEVEGYPGLLNRQEPNAPHGDQEENDDYCGVLAADLATGSVSGIAARILDRGKRTFWIMNNVFPGTFWDHRSDRKDSILEYVLRKIGTLPEDKSFNYGCLFHRYLALVAHAYLCNRVTPLWIYRLGWVYSMTRFDENSHDSWRLNWLLATSYEISQVRSARMSDAVIQFWNRFNARWPGGWSELERAYRANEFHPFGKV